MALRGLVGLVLCVSFASVTPSAAADRVDDDRSSSPGHLESAEREGAEGLGVEPRISGDLPEQTETALREAFPVALQRVHEISECRELFTALGADALERMTTSMYRATTPQMEMRVCKRGASAFTYVSTPQVRLCRRFASLGTEQAATALIHEALHWAGLGEKPRDEDGLHPHDIDRMVRKACDL